LSRISEEAGRRRILLRAAETLVAVYVVLDDVLTPVFRPLVRWLVGLPPIVRLQQLAADLPAYGVLALMAVPFVLGEPAKLYGILLIGSGRWLTGLVVLALAYLATIILVERVYSAGKHKLRTIGWFAFGMDWLLAIRDRVHEWARATTIWAAAKQLLENMRAAYPLLKARAVEAIEWLRLRLRKG
jgi:hypothetical protein